MSASESNRMSTQTPPTLEELARKALLRNQAFTISVLEDIPIMFIPELFKDAFIGRFTSIVKAMVAAWPFPYLPVGSLIKTFNLRIFEDLLDELDVLPTEDMPPKRGKLQELDFRNVRHAFWTGAISLGRHHSAVTVSEKRLKVKTDLYFKYELDEDEIDFLEWVQQFKDSILLCCVYLKIVSLSLDDVRRILTVFEPQHLKILELRIDWSWCTLAQFAPYLSQMRNLHMFSLVQTQDRFGIDNIPGSRQNFHAQKFIFHFSRLRSLQHLSIKGIFFQRQQMQDLLRHLETPLKTFAVTHTQFIMAHLKNMSQCQRLHHLKHLDMTGTLLTCLCMAPLAALLENVAHTLESLQLQGCGITDSQLRVLLPALGQCSQLTWLDLYTNHFSMDALCDLLLHTANLSKMTVERYPAPLESYDELGYVSIERFLHFCSKLMDTLEAIRWPKRIYFATNVCSECFKRCVYSHKIRLCHCLR